MHKNFLSSDLKLLILLNIFKSTVNVSLTDILIYDNSYSDSDYIDDSLFSEADFINRQELKESAILLRTRV